MGTKTLYLVRHGESIQNVGINNELRIPDHAIYLTPDGHRQANAAGAFINLLFKRMGVTKYRMWVSPYKRTRETAEDIKYWLDNIPGIQGDIREDDMLTELQFGIFDSIPKDKIKEIFPAEYEHFQNNRRFNGKFYARRPGGESPFDCEIRQKLFIDTLFRDINANTCPDNIIIVGHGAQLNILRKAIFHYSHEWYESEPNPENCSIQQVILNNGKNSDTGYIFGNPMKEVKHV